MGPQTTKDATWRTLAWAKNMLFQILTIRLRQKMEEQLDFAGFIFNSKRRITGLFLQSLQVQGAFVT